MHKRHRIVLILFLLLIFSVTVSLFPDVSKVFYQKLSSESSSTDAQSTEDSSVSDTVTSSVTDVTEDGNKSASCQTCTEETYDTSDTEAGTVGDDELDGLVSGQDGRYAYGKLPADEQKVYLQMLAAIRDRKGSVTVSTMDTDVIGNVFACVIMDHPELFYIDGYKYIKYMLGGVLEKIAFEPDYTLSADETAARQAKIETYVNTCLSGMPKGQDDYSKVKYIYEYIIDNTDYQTDAADNQNICSVFIGRRSVCQGYAEATQYLLELSGIECATVSGEVDGDPHAWNLVKADGGYYYVDTTWGDATYQKTQGNKKEAGTGSTINYDYLCASSNDIMKTHMLDDTVKMPECTATADNYYIHEGLYFTNVDKERLSKIFDSAYASGRETVSIKCSNDEVYSEMQKYLFDDQRIFDYLRGSGDSVTYSDSGDTDTFTFWL